LFLVNTTCRTIEKFKANVWPLEHLGFKGVEPDVSTACPALIRDENGNMVPPACRRAHGLAVAVDGNVYVPQAVKKMRNQGEVPPPTFGAQLTQPAAGAKVGPGQVLTANATGPNGLAKVEFRSCAGSTCQGVTSALIGTDTTAPYAFTWNTLPANGTYTLKARAFDPAGKIVDSPGVTVTVGGTTRMTAKLTAPGAGTTVSAGQMLSATASGPNGVTKVQFRFCAGSTCQGVTSQLIGTDTTAPYSVAWNRLPANGTYTLTARAFDPAGKIVDSPAVTVTVGTVRELTAQLMSPAPGATVRAGQILSATAAGPTGVAKVQFRYCPGATCQGVTSQWIGEDTTAPYSFAWNALPPSGTYTIKARDFDPANAIADSPTVTVTVDAAGSAMTATSLETPSDDVQPSPSATPAPTNQVVTLSADRGQAGAEVTVTGTGFAPSSTVTLLWDGERQLATATTGPKGRFQATITVPGRATVGEHAITATGPSGKPTQATYHVEQSA
jgi:hypothetical protein